MALPEQLQKQIDAVNAGVKQRMENLEAGDGAPNDDADETDANTPNGHNPEEQSRQSEGAHPQHVAQDEDDENNPTYAQRWRSLQGVYSATQRKLDAAEAQRSNLEQLIAQMQAAPRGQPAGAQKPQTHVTDKDASEYGEDMIEFARRVTRDEVTPLANAVRQLMGRIDQLQGVVPVVQQVANTQAKSASERFYEMLGHKVPDWQHINEMPRFHDWLLSTEPFSGIQRQVLLEDAHKSHDVARVANMFETWQRETGGAAPRAGASAPASAQNTRQTAAQRLEQQVAPGRASTGSAPPAQKQAKMWTHGDIAQFYRDKSGGKFKGREAEAEALERDIFTAQTEGRVRHTA